MGLDMYLSKRTYVQRWDHIKPENQFEVFVNQGGTTYFPIQPKRVSSIIEQVAYWRKANAIHQWFVDNVQNGDDDCKEYYVGTEALERLLDAAKLGLMSREDAKVLLPTQAGFFFGGTEYDEYYYNDLEDTIAQLEPLLAEDGDGDFYYQASW